MAPAEFFRKICTGRKENGIEISFLSLAKPVVIAMLLCSFVVLPNSSSAQIAANTAQSNVVSFNDPVQMPSHQPEAGLLNTATIIIPQGAATQQLINYYESSPFFVSTDQYITWSNQDSTTHTAVADDGSFNTGEIQPGSSSSPIIVQNYGEYPYRCSIHPHMTGFLEVLPLMPDRSETMDPSHSLEQDLLELQHLRLAEQIRMQQIQAIAMSPPPEQRLTQIASVQQDTTDSITFLKELFSMQPEQQVQTLQELLVQIQQDPSQLQAQSSTMGAQIVQTAIGLDPERRDRQFLLTLGGDRDFLEIIQLLSVMPQDQQDQMMGTYTQMSMQWIQELQTREGQIQQASSPNVSGPMPQPMPGAGDGGGPSGDKIYETCIAQGLQEHYCKYATEGSPSDLPILCEPPKVGGLPAYPAAPGC